MKTTAQTSAASSHKFKRPMVAGVLEVIGVLNIVGAAIILVTGEGLVAVVAVVFSFFYFAAASIITSVAETAANTRGIGQQLGSLRDVAVSLQKQLSTPVAVELSGNASAQYYYNDNDTGPYSKSDIQEFRSIGLITDETPVLREGDTEWRTFNKYPEFAVWSAPAPR